jgi:hypothetical protein
MNAGAAAPLDPPPSLRTPEEIMRPEVLASLQPCRISASRALMIAALRERWRITRLQFDLDGVGRGEAFYRIEAGSWTFDFPVFSFEPKAAGRTGRIIGRAWDMMAALVEGPMTPAEVETTREELPKLYSGRASPRTLIWCRSNRSARLFNHTVDRLAQGLQPDIEQIGQACYLMRNTGLDGNGTFGTRSFRTLEDDHPLRPALSAQMLCAYMMRVFAHDLVNHLAQQRSASAARLSPDIARYLGVGNGSALGLLLFVNNHPKLIDRWLGLREEALLAAKSLVLEPADGRIDHLVALLDRAIRFRNEDRVVYHFLPASSTIASGLTEIRRTVLDYRHTGLVAGARTRYPLAALCDLLEPRVHRESLEVLHALLIELVPDLADRSCAALVVDEETVTRPEMKLAELRAIIDRRYRWALDMDLGAPGSDRYVWYKSVNAEEPRRGPREEVGSAFNLAIDVPRLVHATQAAIDANDPGLSVARFLMAHPELRSFVARLQSLAELRFHSPMMNAMADDFVPIEIVRLMNVAIHGIDKTRDYLNRNLRGVLFHGAPLPEDIAAGAEGSWFWPAVPA